MLDGMLAADDDQRDTKHHEHDHAMESVDHVALQLERDFKSIEMAKASAANQISSASAPVPGGNGKEQYRMESRYSQKQQLQQQKQGGKSFGFPPGLGLENSDEEKQSSEFDGNYWPPGLGTHFDPFDRDEYPPELGADGIGKYFPTGVYVESEQLQTQSNSAMPESSDNGEKFSPGPRSSGGNSPGPRSIPSGGMISATASANNTNNIKQAQNQGASGTQSMSGQSNRQHTGKDKGSTAVSPAPGLNKSSSKKDG